jgi:hypothetical protein
MGRMGGREGGGGGGGRRAKWAGRRGAGVDMDICNDIRTVRYSTHGQQKMVLLYGEERQRTTNRMQIGAGYQ